MHLRDSVRRITKVYPALFTTASNSFLLDSIPALAYLDGTVGSSLSMYCCSNTSQEQGPAGHQSVSLA